MRATRRELECARFERPAVGQGVGAMAGSGSDSSTQTIDVGGFACTISPDAPEKSWVPAGFPLPGGGFWTFAEPDAVVVVQDGRLRVAALPFTRSNDDLQILDNAKHMYFSTQQFEAPVGGRLRAEWEMAAQIVSGSEGDLYDGFVSFHLMDMSTGTAVDIFAGNDTVATVYARLPFPGAKVPEPEAGPRYFSLFDEHRGVTSAGEFHRYAITYDRGAGELVFEMDDKELGRQTGVLPIGPCMLALGLMTEKDIQPGRGSASCHGQGAVGTWGRIRISLES